MRCPAPFASRSKSASSAPGRASSAAAGMRRPLASRRWKARTRPPASGQVELELGVDAGRTRAVRIPDQQRLAGAAAEAAHGRRHALGESRRRSRRAVRPRSAPPARAARRSPRAPRRSSSRRSSRGDGSGARPARRARSRRSPDLRPGGRATRRAARGRPSARGRCGSRRASAPCGRRRSRAAAGRAGRSAARRGGAGARRAPRRARARRNVARLPISTLVSGSSATAASRAAGRPACGSTWSLPFISSKVGMRDHGASCSTSRSSRRRSASGSRGRWTAFP